MSINTRKVEGRREVRYKSLDDLLEDARCCVADGSTTIGNWSISQIYQHLTVVLHQGIDGFPSSGFLPLRLIAMMFFKNKKYEILVQVTWAWNGDVLEVCFV